MEQWQYQLSVRETKDSNSTWSHGQKGIMAHYWIKREGKEIKEMAIIISLVESQERINKKSSLFPGYPLFS